LWSGAVVAALWTVTHVASAQTANAGADPVNPTPASFASPVASCPSPDSLTAPYQAQITQLNTLIAQKDVVIGKLQGDIANNNTQIKTLQDDLTAKAQSGARLLIELSDAQKKKADLDNKLAAQAAQAASTDAKRREVLEQLRVATGAQRAELTNRNNELIAQSLAQESALKTTRQDLETQKRKKREHHDESLGLQQRPQRTFQPASQCSARRREA